MFINEDYFKDIKDSDIEDSVIQISDDITIQQPETVEEYMEYFEKNFTDTIIFQLSNWKNGHALKLFDSQQIAEYIEKRMFQVFDMFNIKHSDIILATDYRRSTIPTYITNLGKYKLFRNLDSNNFNFIYAVVYVRFDTMTPNMVLHFIESLMNVLWKSSRDIVDIKFVKKVLSYKEYIELNLSEQKITLNRSLYHTEHDPNYVGSIIDKHYFMSAMTYFFGREKAERLRYEYRKF